MWIYVDFIKYSFVNNLVRVGKWRTWRWALVTASRSVFSAPPVTRAGLSRVLNHVTGGLMAGDDCDGAEMELAAEFRLASGYACLKPCFTGERVSDAGRENAEMEKLRCGFSELSGGMMTPVPFTVCKLDAKQVFYGTFLCLQAVPTPLKPKFPLIHGFPMEASRTLQVDTPLNGPAIPRILFFNEMPPAGQMPHCDCPALSHPCQSRQIKRGSGIPPCICIKHLSDWLAASSICRWWGVTSWFFPSLIFPHILGKQNYPTHIINSSGQIDSHIQIIIYKTSIDATKENFPLPFTLSKILQKSVINKLGPPQTPPTLLSIQQKQDKQVITHFIVLCTKRFRACHVYFIVFMTSLEKLWADFQLFSSLLGRLTPHPCPPPAFQGRQTTGQTYTALLPCEGLKQRPPALWQRCRLLLSLMGFKGGAVCFLLKCLRPLLSFWERKHQGDQYILYADFQQSVTLVGGSGPHGGYAPHYGFDMNLAPRPRECDGCIIWPSCLCRACLTIRAEALQSADEPRSIVKMNGTAPPRFEPFPIRPSGRPAYWAHVSQLLNGICGDARGPAVKRVKRLSSCSGGAWWHLICSIIPHRARVCREKGGYPKIHAPTITQGKAGLRRPPFTPLLTRFAILKINIRRCKDAAGAGHRHAKRLPLFAKVAKHVFPFQSFPPERRVTFAGSRREAPVCFT